MNNLLEFWSLVTDVWQSGVVGIDISRLLSAAGILIGFLLIRRLFTRTVLAWLKSLASKTQTPLDDAVIKTLSTLLA